MAGAHIYLRVYVSGGSDDPDSAERIIGEGKGWFGGDIRLESWTWKHVRQKDVSVNDGSLASILSFTKLLDASSVDLLTYLRAKVELQSAVITMMEDPIDSPFGLIVTFDSLRVLTYSVSASSSGPSVEVTENWELDYQKASFAYVPYDPKNQSDGDDDGSDGSVAGTMAFDVVRPPGSPRQPPDDMSKKDKDKEKGKEGSTGGSASGGAGSGAGTSTDGSAPDKSVDGWDMPPVISGSEGLTRRRSGTGAR